MLLLMQHMMLLRGETTRTMELADLFPLQFPNEGFSECPVLILGLDHGKTTRFNRIQYAGNLPCATKTIERVHLAPWLSFFFYRWHVPNEDFPTFTTNKDWFDLWPKVSTTTSLSPTQRIIMQQTVLLTPAKLA